MIGALTVDMVVYQSMQITITPDIQKKIAALSERYGLMLVLLFGSQSRGDAGQESDVDIAFLPEKPLAPEYDIALNADLAAVFGTDRVDTTDLTRAPPLLRREILEYATVLYDRTGIGFATFEAHTLRSFAEAQPLFEIRREKLRALAGI